MSFKIVAAVPGSAGGPSSKDGRSVVESMFFNWEGSAPEGERLIELPVQVGDCSKGTPKDLGIAFEDCIAVQTNYKGEVDNFNGRTKGKTLVTFGGKRQGRAGYGSVTVPLDEIPEFCRLALQAHNAITQGIEQIDDEADVNEAASSLTD